MNIDTTFISLGHRCSTSSILKKLNLKSESFPFDWMVSSLYCIKDCIETNFIHFMNKELYINIGNGYDYNIYYNKPVINIPITTPDFLRLNCGLNHFYMSNLNDYLYYEICVLRFEKMLKSDISKYFCYIHPLISEIDYNTSYNTIINEFNEFNNYIQTKTTNSFCIYFILIKDTDCKETYNIIIQDNKMIVYRINVNINFIDDGNIFMGDSIKETIIIENIIKSYSNGICKQCTETYTL